MAGICGFIIKEPESNNLERYKAALSKMTAKLGSIPSQISNHININNIFVANTVSISAKENLNFIVNTELKILCVMEGLVFIESEDKTHIEEKYNFISHNNSNYITYLYKIYGTKIVDRLTGHYNIFIYSIESREAVLFNDRLGYLPLYIYESDKYFVFASKIESILNSQLMDKISFDYISLYEQFIFNYPLSDNTFIKNIRTVSSSSVFKFDKGVVEVNRYWSVESLFNRSAPLKLQDSINLIDQELKNTLQKVISINNDKITLSLSGGWDGRLVLSYLAAKYSDRINIYSFGTLNSKDVTIPSQIASKEGLNYTPFILDDNYLNNHFSSCASDTILMSNGLRSYKRAHYLYTMRQLALEAEMIISGNFGDEVFKFASIKPSAVISSNLIDLISDKFNVHACVLRLKGSVFLGQQDHYNEYIDELEERLVDFKKQYNLSDNLSENFFIIKLSLIARKYFGYENNSYNDFIFNFSPFTDHDFLSVLSKTVYCGIYSPFNSNRIKYKEMSSILYAKLIRSNFNNLSIYQTTRNYKIKDVLTITGKLKIIATKIINHYVKESDNYNTKPTDDIFEEFNTAKLLNHSKLQFIGSDAERSNINSIRFWLNHIHSNYKVD